MKSSKPRNPVAKNMPSNSRHKNKKREEELGRTRHKKGGGMHKK